MADYPSEVLWLKANKDILNLKKVAEQIGVPVKNLWNFCNDKHSLNKMWWTKTTKWVKNVREGTT